MRNYLHLYDYAAWALAVGVQIWMLTKLRYRRRSMFEIFLLFNVCKSFCLWIIAQTLTASAYCNAYIAFTAIDAGLQILVMIELINDLRISAEIPNATFRSFLLYSLSLMGMLICIGCLNDRSQGVDYYLMAERIIPLAQVAAFVSVVSFSAFWGMAWRRESG